MCFSTNHTSCKSDPPPHTARETTPTTPALSRHCVINEASRFSYAISSYGRKNGMSITSACVSTVGSRVPLKCFHHFNEPAKADSRFSRLACIKTHHQLALSQNHVHLFWECGNEYNAPHCSVADFKARQPYHWIMSRECPCMPYPSNDYQAS